MIKSDFPDTSLSTSFQLETPLATTLFCLLLLGQISTQALVLSMHLSMLLPLVINFRCCSLSHTCGTSQCTTSTEFPSDTVAVSSSGNANSVTSHYVKPCPFGLHRALFSRCSPTTSFKVQEDYQEFPRANTLVCFLSPLYPPLSNPHHPSAQF